MIEPMGWLLLAVGIFGALGFFYWWTSTTEQRRLRDRFRRLSPRGRRRAELHAFDDQEEAARMLLQNREAATHRGARRIFQWGGFGAVGGGGSSGADAADGGGDGGD